MNSKYMLWARLMSLIETKVSVVGWALPTINFPMMLYYQCFFPDTESPHGIAGNAMKMLVIG